MKTENIQFITIASSSNSRKVSKEFEEIQNRKYNEIYKRVMAGENGPFVIDYYQGKEPKIINIGKQKQGFFKTFKNIFKKIFKK